MRLATAKVRSLFISALALFTFLTILPVGPVFSQSHDPASTLQVVTWEAQIFGHTQLGQACWLTGPDGALRLDVLPGAIPRLGLSNLMGQLGEGFTLVLGAGNSGTFNPWQREWQNIDVITAGWARLVTTILAGGDSSELVSTGACQLLSRSSDPVAPQLRFSAWRSLPTRSLPIRIQLPALHDLSPTDSIDSAEENAGISRPLSVFRTIMVERGTGRGGSQEILTMAPNGTDSEPGWELKSSRKPGRIIFSHLEGWFIQPPGPEVFTPLWPLEQLVELGEKNAGTSARP